MPISPLYLSSLQGYPPLCLVGTLANRINSLCDQREPLRSEKRQVLDCTCQVGIFKDGIAKGLPGRFCYNFK